MNRDAWTMYHSPDVMLVHKWYLTKLENQLETIKEHFKNRPMINKNNFYESDSWFIQLKKILEDSEFTTNSEDENDEA